MGGRAIVAGEIHGCYTERLCLLEKCGRTARDVKSPKEPETAICLVSWRITLPVTVFSPAMDGSLCIQRTGMAPSSRDLQETTHRHIQLPLGILAPA